MSAPERPGPLAGLRVLEIGSIGPGPFCAMLLAEMGADVLRVDKVAGALISGPSHDHASELLHRSRRSAGIDLKHPDGVATVLRLAEGADALVEGFRPGVLERLGLGPEDCRTRNPRLIYGRMTGWGQDGPYAQLAGHDINYLAVSGTLSLIGRRGQPPTPPLGLLGDFGAGAMQLAFGILAALLERERSGRGQIVDAAIVDGAALLATMWHGYLQVGAWSPERGTNVGDSGAPYYDAYETADGRYVAVGAIEPRFYAELLDVLELDPASLPAQDDRDRWPEMKRIFANRIRRRTREEWWERARGRDACLTPVLEVNELPDDPHLRARGTIVRSSGLAQPTPAPWFERTPGSVRSDPPLPGEHTAEALADWGFADDEIRALRRSGAVSRDTDAPAP